MGIDFTPERWEETKTTYAAWWRKELERPIFPVILTGRDPGRPEPAAPLLTQATCHQLDIPAEDIIDRLDYELSRYLFLGDAFPWVNLSAFGPGVVAAFLGADIGNATGNVWFAPREVRPISQIHFKYDPDNPWLRRLRDLYVAGTACWQGQVVMGMTDLGGTLDILSTFRPGEDLLMDMIAEPEEVKRVTWEIHHLWRRFYEDLSEACIPQAQGSVAWDGLFCEEDFYMLQCDLAYMIGPDMFAKLVKPELEATCEWLPRSFYHLDGNGQLPHVEHLLDMETLDGIQWVAGAQEAGHTHADWLNLYRRIHAAGKRIELVGFYGFDVLDRVVDALGGDGGALVQFRVEDAMVRRDYYAKNLEKCGVPVA